ncbi:type II restriction endonuclease subunit M [Halarcobacter ebronensis]|uniref:site-specific DNA-methyltransferase (adenine-specific) n=1 Tax=Halarcobacter ebronensis TaxID=1462615 RepID=A0A4Q0YBJ4_9BACT|nr:N-6 DNA methylase [Halarcobacter ebronensis]RXJ67682.1 type II restriction endonuclease subunit M [Halarcobacter ebronensis]
MAKNEAKTDIDLFNYLTNNKEFSKSWIPKKTKNKHIQEILSKATKAETEDNRGEPDLIYLNEEKKLLILIENKDKIKDHKSKNGDKPKDYAIDGIKHYLKFFLKNKITNLNETTQKVIKEFKIIGIAFSGDINDNLNHLINTFIIQEDKIKDISILEFLNEEDYIALFENLDLEFISNNISRSSSEINRILRNIDSQKRPVLLSALMICLYEKNDFHNDFKTNYLQWNIKNIIRNIPTTIEDILINENIDINKINILKNELSFIKTDTDLNDTEILKEILTELEDNVIPLFNKKSSYDIIGKFYEEFLRYAGIANVKKGIVLTPNHITKLFTELIDIKTNDIIFDACCGTGAFLIAGMNKLIETIENSKIANKQEKISNIKQNQLLGFEKSNTMYSLAISNMLFRGDGKSKIYNIDFFADEATNILENIKPSIGFINPPYGGKDNKSNPTKKEIQFLEKMLDNVSRYGIIIAPLSTFFKDETERNRILSKHTLKYVINMPSELFQPNASTHTAIAVFETNLPHDDKEIILYELSDDGFVLSKNKGRTDVYNKWQTKKKNLFDKLANPKKFNDGINLVYKKITNDEEWILQAHKKNDFSLLTDNNFISTIKQNVIFNIKNKLNLLFENIDELSLMELFNKNNINSESIDSTQINLFDKVKWQEFKLTDIFEIQKGERLVEADRLEGSMPLITASAVNNGITSFIDYDTFLSKKKIFENQITIDMFGSVFYHNYPYFSDDNIHTLLLKDLNKDKLNDINQIFLVTILKQLSSKYGYGRQVRIQRLENEIIELPIIKKNKIHWDFIENYIKTLPYSKNLTT